MAHPVLQISIVNRLLARLTADDFALVAAHLEPIDCPLGLVLVLPEEIMPDVIFLDCGVASIVIVSPGGDAVEGGIVGREGFVAPNAVLGADKIPHRIEMQMAGGGHRIGRADLLARSAQSRGLHEALLRFANVMAVQSAYTVLSNTIYTTEERLARWLLMCHDRSDSDDLALTHRFMAVMLAVRRASVTQALHALEGRNLIETMRGYVTIRNRAALEDYAGDAYGKPEAEYRRLLGPM